MRCRRYKHSAGSARGDRGSNAQAKPSIDLRCNAFSKMQSMVLQTPGRPSEAAAELWQQRRAARILAVHCHLTSFCCIPSAVGRTPTPHKRCRGQLDVTPRGHKA